jgi:Mg-chelatase subunit ChlD
LEEPAEYLVIPCGHQCGCAKCLQTVQQSQGKCPICRGTINQFIKVFAVGDIERDEQDLLESERKLHAPGGASSATSGWSDDEEEDAEVEGKALAGGPASTDKSKALSIEVGVYSGGLQSPPASAASAAPQQSPPASAASATPEDTKSSSSEAPKGRLIHASVHVTPPDIQTRQKLDVCCVVDISGSMSNNATYQDPENPDEVLQSELSILDLVKHAVKTVIQTLTPEDRLSIVAFDNKAELALKLTTMDSEGKVAAQLAVDSLLPRNATNIWEGLRNGMEALKSEVEAAESKRGGNRKKCLFLLTDGQPTTSPPHGHRAAFKAYKEKNPDLRCQVNTFGFGYKLDSGVLLELAEEGGGTMSFVPDAKILGTCFVDCLSNCASTLTQRAQLHLCLENGSTFPKTEPADQHHYAGLHWEDTSWGRVVDLGYLQYGQARDVLVPVLIPESFTTSEQAFVEAIIVYKEDAGPDGEGRDIRASSKGYLTAQEEGAASATPAKSLLSYWRSQMVQKGGELVVGLTAPFVTKKQAQEAHAEWHALSGRMAADLTVLAAKGTWPEEQKLLHALLKDTGGRMTKALTTKQRFNRWGKHYLRAVIRAHQLQVCTNFMDPGLQLYGGSLFSKIRDEGGKIFVTLPPPTPCVAVPEEVAIIARQYGHNIGTSGGTAAAAPDMSGYYGGGGGGCFHAACTVPVADPASLHARQASWTGDQVQAVGFRPTAIPELAKGDWVDTGMRRPSALGGGGAKPLPVLARVLCVVKLPRDPAKPLVTISAPTKEAEGAPHTHGPLVVTPGHPIKLATAGTSASTWTTPRELVELQAAAAFKEGTAATGTAVLKADYWSPPDGSITSGSGGSGVDTVYTLVLEQPSKHHTALVNGVVCLLWGHELSEPAVAHPYLGAHKVIADLSAMPGFEQGSVTVTGSLRSKPTGQVVKLLHSWKE